MARPIDERDLERALDDLGARLTYPKRDLWPAVRQRNAARHRWHGADLRRTTRCITRRGDRSRRVRGPDTRGARRSRRDLRGDRTGPGHARLWVGEGHSGVAAGRRERARRGGPRPLRSGGPRQERGARDQGRVRLGERWPWLLAL